MGPEIVVPFTFFAFLTTIIVVPVMMKERTKRSAHELISRAIDRGQQLDPALVQQLTDNMLQEGNRARRSFGSAVIMLALAAAFVGIAFVSGDGFGMHDGALIPAVLLGSLGAAYLVLSIIDFIGRPRTTA